MKELERIQRENTIYRIAKDVNGFFCHQYKSLDDSENPSYNDGWTTDYMSLCCITVHRPYPYEAPSNYYAKRRAGYSVQESLS